MKYSNDKWGDLSEEFTQIDDKFRNTEQFVYNKLDQSKSCPAVISERALSIKSTSSSRSKKFTNSSARNQALTDAAASKLEASYSTAIAKKENERQLREANQGKEKEKAEAKYEYDIAVLSAEKNAAIAKTRLEAFESCIEVTPNLEDPVQAESSHTKTTEGVENMVSPTRPPTNNIVHPLQETLSAKFELLNSLNKWLTNILAQ